MRRGLADVNRVVNVMSGACKCLTIFILARLVGLLRLLDGAVVVHEDEGLDIFGVLLAVGTRIARAEITFGLVFGELAQSWRLVLTSIPLLASDHLSLDGI